MTIDNTFSNLTYLLSMTDGDSRLGAAKNGILSVPERKFKRARDPIR